MKPVLQALLIAEHVYQDVSGKKVIAGTFNAIRLRNGKPPKTIQKPDGTIATRVEGGGAGAPYAYISLTDVWDNTKLELQFVSLKRNRVLFDTEIKIKCKDRLATVEIISQLPRLDIPEPGIYAFEVVYGGEIIGSHRIIARAADDSDES